MRFVCLIGLAACLLASVSATAGTINPALQAMMDQTQADQPMSVIVNMLHQAPIAELNQALHVQNATRRVRHHDVVLALQSARESQRPLQGYLDAQVRSGSVLGYTSYWISNLLVVQASKAEIERIAARSDVDLVEPNFNYSLTKPVSGGGHDIGRECEPTRDRGIGVTPGLRAIRAPEVWYGLGINGSGALIGGLDTGVDGHHPALASRWRGVNGTHPWQECWLDLLGNGTQFPVDNYGHGTHTMGTMTGLGATTQDTIGVAWGATWIATNPIDQGVGSGFDNDVVTAFQWFADPDGNPNTVDDVPDVVQNSWGINEGFSGSPPYTDCDSRWWAAIDNCEAASVCVTWSAGNEGSGAQTLRSPADRATTLTNCFSVGAVDATSYNWPYPIASWSSRGPSGCNVPPDQKIKPEVSAPGVNVYSSTPNNTYGNMSGTSMAGPHVAGVVGLMRSANPNLDVDSIKNILMSTSRDEGPAGEDNTYGWGFIDAYAAVQMATVGFGSLDGYVRNASWGNAPLGGAVVTLLESGSRFTSDANGFYHGAGAAGSYHAVASMGGFRPDTSVVVLVANQTTHQDFGLTDIAGPQISNVTQLGTVYDHTGPYVIEATITDFSTVAAARLYYRTNHGSWGYVPMTGAISVWRGSIPGMPTGTKIDYYIWAQDGIGMTSVYPLGAPASFYTFFITDLFYAYAGEDPADNNWHLGMTGDNATTGIWIRDDPVGTVYNGEQCQPEDDHTVDPGVKCFVTGNGTVGGAPGDSDVDGGCTTLQSPAFDLSAADSAFVAYWRWFAMMGLSSDDQFAVDVSSDGGTNWVPLERVTTNANSWQKAVVELSSIITLSNQVVFRWVACDNGSGGLIEAAIDDFSLETYTQTISGVSDARPVPANGLAQNRPNPFVPEKVFTTINFRLSNPADARLDVYDAAGRMVRTLVNGPLQSGAHNIEWNGRDDLGHEVGAGIYFYRLKAGAFEQSRRMTILK